MTIHKEGFSILIYLLIFFLIVNIATCYFSTNNKISYTVIGISVIIYLLVLQFFRSPTVHTPIDENIVYAPAEGKIVSIETVFEDEFLKTKCIQVSIFMSPFNVHVNRNPISGKVLYAQYHPGKYLVAWHPKSSTLNERTSIAIQNKQGDTLLMRQIAGAVARRIKFYVQKNDTVIQGEEFGFIKFGSRVDVFLPLSYKILVKIGDKTTGGKTILASTP
ncbi:MAG: phosphatidylserine decarboxylase family protein [Chitinophagaceae bacterium]|nr:phosphatidylserine decarboxylase family protein [Chitinophagaceae bacterium]